MDAGELRKVGESNERPGSRHAPRTLRLQPTPSFFTSNQSNRLRLPERYDRALVKVVKSEGMTFAYVDMTKQIIRYLDHGGH